MSHNYCVSESTKKQLGIKSVKYNVKKQLTYPYRCNLSKPNTDVFYFWPATLKLPIKYKYLFIPVILIIN